MGFKRTTEGRVFFQNNDAAGANDEPEAGQSSARSYEGIGKPVEKVANQRAEYTQLQILSLLKGLNDKLKTTQAERKQMRQELEEYRNIIEDLEHKAARSEKAYAALLGKIEGGASGGNFEGRAVQAEKIARETLNELKETRKLVLELEEKTENADKAVSTLKDMQREQAQNVAKTTAGYAQLAKRIKEGEERQEDMGSRIEEAISQQARLVRKIDKSIEDRARFMRKIERIEETVIQTRDSLNAKAMVLLTDQGAAARVALEDGPDNDGPLMLSDEGAVASSSAPAVQSSKLSQLGGAFVVGLICLLAGWGISEMQKPQLPDFVQMGVETGTVNVEPEAPSAETARQTTEQQSWQVYDDAPQFSENTGSEIEQPVYDPAPVDVGAADDIGTLTLQSDEELLKLLDEDAGQVGEIMNQIEPGSEQKIVQAQKEQVAALQPSDMSEADASAEPAAIPPVKEPALSDFVAPEPKAIGIPSKMQPDSALPESIKDIEKQAFNGVPEAQHDLAAIYTAGHAGVRQDYGRAAYWFKQAADNGITNAAYNLGVLNHQGLGMKANVQEAIAWYSMAAEGGHPEAQYNLGIAYIEGIGVPYEPARAAAYFREAAQKGIKEAAYNLGLIYENGLLGKPQPDEALVWYKTAADAGSPEAKAALEQLAKTLDIKLEDVNKLVDSMKGADAGAVPSEAQTPFDKAQDEQKTAQNSAQVLTNIAAVKPLVARNTEETAVPVEDFPYEAQEQEQNTVAQIQEYLMRIGLFPGPADGVSGPLTSDAVRSYQSSNGLDVDGEASRDVLAHMLANGGAGNVKLADTEGPNDLGSRAY